MFYTIYKITNLLNGRFYIGMHKTDNLDDGYMGSGKLIRLAIKKYGKENFLKEILEVFDNESDMRAREKELVTLSSESYNLCEGGKGGFGYINRSNFTKFSGKSHTEETKDVISKKMLGNKHFNGKSHTEESKRKIGQSVKLKLKGSVKSEEHKRKIAESVKRRYEEKRIAALSS